MFLQSIGIDRSSPGTPSSRGKRQRIMIAFRCRTPKTRSRQRAWTSGNNDTPRYKIQQGTGEITKCFFHRVDEVYKVLSRIQMTPLLAQTLTGHGGFAQYLNRFKLKNSPYCACAPDKVQDVLHVFE
ncbi:hypothetical protein EVAR_104011_1 [Eumeta japonica]|uniref:Uncharacterized protein n=1 Tax=Eumeta variegata TaxID=151549 RepID=A0A4C1XVT4_EUMVA|nr:hypothetical protein EVAR_104011_1 [Eumeta japonica]